MNLEQQAARDQALTVRCPYLPCLAQPGDPCRNRDGHELVSQIAHVDRMRDAGVEILAVPTNADELADQPTRKWTPTSAIEGDR